MGHSFESCIDPEQLLQPSPMHDRGPGLSSQLQPSLMEFIDGSLEYQRTANEATPRTGQEDLKELSYGTSSDMPRYLAMPIDLQHQRPDSTDGNHNNTTQKVRAAGSIHEHTFIEQQDERFNFAHSRRSSRSSNKFTSDESGLDKRERNRMAASKCRKKQKLANSELQERARIMDQQHNLLIAHKASLESEMIGLKNELLLHGSCDCGPISDYLMQAAKKFVKGRGEDTESVENMGNLRERPTSNNYEPYIP